MPGYHIGFNVQTSHVQILIPMSHTMLVLRYVRCREVLRKNRMWSNRTMQHYMSYMVDFIDKEWCLRDRRLKSMFLHKDHSAENIMEALGIFLLRIRPA